jgi:hypothetical protein
MTKDPEVNTFLIATGFGCFQPVLVSREMRQIAETRNERFGSLYSRRVKGLLIFDQFL